MRAKADKMGVTSQERDGLAVLHTDRARTLVDCLDRLDLGGGFEEVFRSVEAWTTVDPADVLKYLQVLDKSTLYAKTGYVLESFAPRWGLTQVDLETFRKKLPHSAVYLGRRDQPGRYIARWKLLVPTQFEALTQTS
jgi:predicted transcriptional regulator of viral defense system